jgi:peptidoglycan/LPS O-acetylase OafA/YrhL
MARRLAFVATVAAALVAVSSPAMAFQHDRVQNPVVHWALDIAILAIVVAPIWTALLWGKGRSKWLLAGLIGLVQAPVAILGFSPDASALFAGSGLFLGLAITVAAIVYTRRVTRLEQARAQQELAGEAS